MRDLPFKTGDIITIEGKKYEVLINPNQPKFCNLYEPGKPHTFDHHLGQIYIKPSQGLISYYYPHRAKNRILGLNAHVEFEIDYFFSQIDYPAKGQRGNTQNGQKCDNCGAIDVVIQSPDQYEGWCRKCAWDDATADSRAYDARTEQLDGDVW